MLQITAHLSSELTARTNYVCEKAASDICPGSFNQPTSDYPCMLSEGLNEMV